MRINWQALIESISCLSLASVITYLLYTDMYLMLVTPKAKPFLYITIITLISWCFISLRRITTYSYHHNYNHCIPIMALVIVLGGPLLIPSLSSVYSAVPESEAKTTAPASAHPIYRTHEEFVAAQKNGRTPVASANGAYANRVNQEEHDDGIDDANKLITLTSDNFYNTILKISTHLNDYKGYEIIMTGFIAREDETLLPNQFQLSRILMICCVADVAPFGLACEYDGNLDLPDKSWFTMRGIIEERDYHGLKQPLVKISVIRSASSIPGYVYPY